MDTMRSRKRVLTIVHALVGGALLAAGALIVALHFFLEHNVPGYALLIAGGSLVFSGVIELSVLAILRSVLNENKEKNNA